MGARVHDMTMSQMDKSLTDAAPSDSLRRMLRESMYLASGLPVAIASFTVLMCGLSMSVSAVILVGLPAAILTLLVARGFAKLERARMYALGYDLPPATYRPLSGQFRTWLAILQDSQSWLDVLHGIVVMPLAVITFTIALFWWSAAL